MTSTRMRLGQDPRRLFVPREQLPAPSQRARSTKSSDGSTVREHHPPSSSLGVRPYSSNPSREERLRPCRHPPCVSGYLRGQLIPFRIHLQSNPTLGTKHGDAVQEALREGRRPLLSQDARAFIHIKNLNRLSTRRGKGWCTASARPRATPTASGTPKRVAWWRTKTSFSSKHHQI